MPHTTTTPAASRKVEARPAASEVWLARLPKNLEIDDGGWLMVLASPATMLRPTRVPLCGTESARSPWRHAKALKAFSRGREARFINSPAPFQMARRRHAPLVKLMSAH